MTDTDDLARRFATAQDEAQRLPQRPDNPTLLKIYALYKQATEGDNTAARPKFSEVVARAKWDAWTATKGLSAEEAQRRYVELIDSLK